MTKSYTPYSPRNKFGLTPNETRLIKNQTLSKAIQAIRRRTGYTYDHAANMIRRYLESREVHNAKYP